MKRITTFIPFILLFALLALLFRQLFYGTDHVLPSNLIGQPVPSFSLPQLKDPTQSVTKQMLVGKPSLLNVWATWCYACNIEHPMLQKIHDDYHVNIIGIDYKDKPDEAINYLNEHGNPYTEVAQDRSGDFAIDLGVYGTPETFVLNKKGEIIYRQVGIIDEAIWQQKIWPLLKAAEEN